MPKTPIEKRSLADLGYEEACNSVMEWLNSEQCELHRHPLGFLRADLHKDGLRTLRLHVWPRGLRHEQDPLWPVHTHIFDLTSLVLIGSITNETYTMDWNTPTQRVYEAKYTADESILLSTQKTCTAELVSRETVASGGHYRIANGAFHQSIVPKEMLAATIVETIQIGGTPLVIGELEGKPEYRLSRMSVSKAEGEYVARELIERLHRLRD